MFSPYEHAQYDKRLVERSESLLHVLAHAGIGTLWRDNQTGCKGVCTGLPYESFEHGHDPVDCDRNGCRDQAMLRDLAQAAGSGGDTVLVLHQLGNHGPSYYKRYPRSLGKFQPACESADLAQCGRSAIVNAYDNATLNTDDFLARTIAALAAMHSRETALIYLSDHGESLGENGLYLHGIPYAIAPATQTQVPMVMWFSPEMAKDRGIDLACLRRRAAQPASHDNLFHSVLGLMQVRTRAYDRRRDLFAGCDRAGPVAAG
jgi:lipid A ethanolaminephosphotransferase